MDRPRADRGPAVRSGTCGLRDCLPAEDAAAGRGGLDLRKEDERERQSAIRAILPEERGVARRLRTVRRVARASQARELERVAAGVSASRSSGAPEGQEGAC